MTRGNYAYQDYRAGRAATPRVSTPGRRRAGHRARNKFRLKSIIVIAICFAACLVMCNRYVQISGQVAEYTRLEAELSDLEARNIQITLEIESAVNSREIEEYAANVLGMTKPQHYQIVYVNPQSKGVMGKVAKNQER